MYGRGPPPQDNGWGARQGGGAGFSPQQQQQPGYHQPPPHFQPPRHAGLGSTGSAPNLPRPPHLAGSPGGPPGMPQQVWTGEKYSLFVGSIADGVSDGWLERILATVGTVLSMRRPSPPFAFVEYSDAESVLRCLEVVNGALLPAKSGGEKALLVKADEKTTARLDEYKTTRVKSESTDDHLLQSKDDLAAIIVRMKAGDLPSSSTPSNTSAPHPSGGRSLSHLQDLDAQDLPEQHREIVTSEIALFRQRAEKRAAEKKEMEAQMEARRHAPAPSGGNSGQQNRGWGPRGGAAPGVVDPQSYNKPIGFVQPGAEKQAAPAEPVIDDAQRERERAERAHREAQALFEDRERRYEARERARIAGYEREKNRERVLQDQEDRDRVMMRERLATWDDAREAEKGREAFYSDRLRWRAQRKPFRARELEAEARDRQAEETQLAAVSKASDAFLDQQADMLAQMSKGELKTGHQAGDEPAVKLSFGATTKPVVKAPAPVRAPVLGSAEDEDEGKKKRALIPLSYSDDEDEKPKGKLSAAEREKKAKAIGDKVPQDKEGLWSYSVKWSALTEDIINKKIAPFATKTIVEYLGSEEEELLSAVTSHVRAHKDAAALVEELEPVLDEEATEFVVKVFKILIYETELARAGISL